MSPSSSLTIVGASARAAAQSALRAGFTPIARDLFGDRDLHSTRSPLLAIAASLYPLGFEAILKATPPGCPWIYTGALENHPDLIDRMAKIRPLWGISGEPLRRCRDPIAVTVAMKSRGLPAPLVRPSDDGVPRDGTWLVKPLASAGGRQVRPWLADSVVPPRPSYFQERMDGTSLAAIFVGQGRRAALAGVSRQKIGRASHPFAYEGSMGPWPISGRARRAIVAMGEALGDEFGLRGLFGVDLILDANDEPFPVEVNPRYTASVEVLELAMGRSLLLDHAIAFGADPGATNRPRRTPPAVVGKMILFADWRCRLPALDSWRPRFPIPSSYVVPHVADIPAAGQIFEEGEPVLTVMARGSSVERCGRALGQRLERWSNRLIPGRLNSEAAAPPLPREKSGDPRRP